MPVFSAREKIPSRGYISHPTHNYVTRLKINNYPYIATGVAPRRGLQRRGLQRRGSQRRAGERSAQRQEAYSGAIACSEINTLPGG